jgi:hypothetical protein
LVADPPGGQGSPANLAARQAPHNHKPQETSMDKQLETQADPQADLQPDPTKVTLTTESINGQWIPLVTVDKFVDLVFGQKLEPTVKGWPKLPGGLILSIRKFEVCGNKIYRLVWEGRGQQWLADEDKKRYTTRMGAIAAGYELAAATGAFFDEGR